MQHRELTDKIIGCCYKVYNVLGYGFLESVYEKALLIELNKAGFNAQAQQEVLVHFKRKIRDINYYKNNPVNPVNPV
jgi:GxxExxY protein